MKSRRRRCNNLQYRSHSYGVRILIVIGSLDVDSRLVIVSLVLSKHLEGLLQTTITAFNAKSLTGTEHGSRLRAVIVQHSLRDTLKVLFLQSGRV